MRAALTRLLEGVSRADLAQRSARITAHYRAGRGSDLAVRDRLDALAYAAARLPATRAAVAQALTRLSAARPALAPATLLDLGAGCGAATLAALDAFPDLARATLIDRNATMLALARDLCADAATAIDAREDDLRTFDQADSADLVVMAYVLVEMTPQNALALALRAFAPAREALVLVEPGTPAGFERLRAARAALIEAGACIAAPCPHLRPCPMVAPDWCRFGVRVQRSRDHIAVKGADAPFEDEPFIYLAATRGAGAAPGARMIARPRRERGGLAARLCCADGAIREVLAPARDKRAMRAVRRLDEGDLWPL